MSDYVSSRTFSTDTQYADHDFEPVGQVGSTVPAKSKGHVPTRAWLVSSGDEFVKTFDIGVSFATDPQAHGRSVISRLRSALEDFRRIIGPDKVVQGLVVAGETAERRVVVLTEEHTDDAYSAAAKIQDRLFLAELGEVEVSVWALQGRNAKEVAQSIGTLL